MIFAGVALCFAARTSPYPPSLTRKKTNAARGNCPFVASSKARFSGDGKYAFFKKWGVTLQY